MGLYHLRGGRVGVYYEGLSVGSESRGWVGA